MNNVEYITHIIWRDLRALADVEDSKELVKFMIELHTREVYTCIITILT